MPEVHVSNHPFICHKLAQLRDRSTQPPAFRALVRSLSQALFFESAHDFPLAPVSVQTPLEVTGAHMLAGRIGLVPVLRAGLGMADAILEMLPEAAVWHVGLYRDHHTLSPREYYNNLPEQLPLDLAIVLDPMLATGGSAIHTIGLLKAAGVPAIKFLGLLAAPEGVAALTAAHPDVPLYLAAVDTRLNEVGYICPGLGDAGDRQFGT